MNSFRSLPLEAASLISRPLSHSTPWRSLPSPLNLRKTPHLPLTSNPYHFYHNHSHPSSPSRPSSFLPVPFITESLGGISHTTDLFSRLLKERIVAVYGEVDERMAATVTASLLFLEADDPSKPINLYINSPGGSVSAGLAIYDTLQYITPEITTICLGQAASMGSLLLAGGSPGKRFALPHSSVMLHQPSGGYFGTAADVAIHAKEILRVRGELNRIYLRHLTPMVRDIDADAEGASINNDAAGGSEPAAKWKPAPHKKTIEEIEKMMERDYFLSATEALELGVVDEIMGSRKTVNLQEGEKKDG